eukprot:2002393-Amphidinium_carterae.1
MACAMGRMLCSELLCAIVLLCLFTEAFARPPRKQNVEQGSLGKNTDENVLELTTWFVSVMTFPLFVGIFVLGVLIGVLVLATLVIMGLAAGLRALQSSADSKE